MPLVSTAAQSHVQPYKANFTHLVCTSCLMHERQGLHCLCRLHAWRVFRWSAICVQEAGDQDKGLSPEELERMEMMHKYVLSNAHFYCETVDISRPFPSSSPLDDPSWEFVWNRWLSAALRAVGLPTHCPHLMQVCLCRIPTLSVI